MRIFFKKFFWIKSLWKGKFSEYPALKLFGTLGQRKEATPQQLRALSRRVRFTSKLKGHKYLWGDMKYIREITFSRVEKINLLNMTKDL